MEPTNTDQAAPTSFNDFFKWCQQHLKERGWGRLDEAAARYLRAWGLASTSNTTDTGCAIKRLLDAVPHARITKARLVDAALQGDDAGETEWVLPSEVGLHGRPTYQMRSMLSHTRVNGRTLLLTSWEPTYEPAGNLPSGEINQYRRRRHHLVERTFIEAEAKED
ncbi:unnamed protein product [Phytophthora fragariaefolia]|uniref:Unnamed protein product n=1 Tax=Phytophthora fragariaefolia TaxID=1490495 RepID=A0A9W6XUK7_9STRA|nr:unnamed protein product [Phytophthora fragariaefolia]